MARLTILLCSHNEHKRRELEQVLAGWDLALLDATDYPPETGETFAENARAKAMFGREVGPADAWMLGEDSGLELAALDGAPGVQTARWADGHHVERALDALAGRSDRAARYVCCCRRRGAGRSRGVCHRRARWGDRARAAWHRRLRLRSGLHSRWRGEDRRRARRYVEVHALPPSACRSHAPRGDGVRPARLSLRGGAPSTS